MKNVLAEKGTFMGEILKETAVERDVCVCVCVVDGDEKGKEEE